MTETFSVLREYRRRIEAMLDDPECSGDLFALGVSLLDYAILRIDVNERSWRYYGSRAWGSDRHGYTVRDVLRRDIRRYDALKDAEARDPACRCGAPMIRRKGPCGNSAGRRALLTDPDTGRKQWLAACSRHADWFDVRVRANRERCEVETITIPAANTGGVLARHIPEIDWQATWRKLDPTWTPPPEGEDEPTRSKPKLSLILGGA